jgi:peptide methionine sulfoxide reductase msrA/msrB
MKKAFVAVGIVVVCSVLYYGISPFFSNTIVHDVIPENLTAEQGNTMEKTIPLSFPLVGTAGHGATGTVRLIEHEGKKTLRYENFKTINGPDLFVYLSSDLKATKFVNLGELKATEGDINYEIPPTTDLSLFKYVLVWCKQFGVLFNYADITVPKEEDAKSEMKKEKAIVPSGPQTALLANGCFWCVEHDLAKVEGVIDVVSGYAGGTTENPTYENATAGGHKEVVQVTYDPSKVSYANLVEHVIKHGDPTDALGSFHDRGLQYAPAIYYKNDAEKAEARRVIAAVDALHVFPNPLPLSVLPTVKFYPAEDYHQDYSEKNPIRYNYYRTGSGRSAFIEKTWGTRANIFEVPAQSVVISLQNEVTQYNAMSWNDFQKPTAEELKAKLTTLQYKVTQKEGTESPFANAYDKNYEAGIYVDIVSGEPLYFSKDKYDSGTGWPSFVKPISDDAVTLKEDDGLFTSRTEVRSKHADSHVGHVFDDGPKDRGGKRYCMNSAAMRFIEKADMEKEGYAYLLGQI